MNSLAEQLLELLLFGAIAFVILSSAWRKGFFQWPLVETQTSRLRLFHVALAFLFYYGSVFFLGSPIAFILRLILRNISLANPSLHFLVLLHVSISLTAACLLFFLIRALPKELSLLIWHRSKKLFSPVKNIAMGSMTWAIAFPCSLFVGQLIHFCLRFGFDIAEVPDQTAVKFLKMISSNPSLFLLSGFAIVGLAPFVEEILFRGFLQTYLKGFFGPKVAILLTSLSFAFFHFNQQQGAGNFPIIGSLLMFSLFLGFIYERQNSLLSSMSLHATFNLLSMLNLYFLGGSFHSIW